MQNHCETYNMSYTTYNKQINQIFLMRNKAFNHL